MKKYSIILIVLAATVLLFIVFLALYTNIMNNSSFCIGCELFKSLVQLFLIIFVGGIIQFSYARISKQKEQEEQQKEKNLAEYRTSLYQHQLSNAIQLLNSKNPKDEITAIMVLTELGNGYPHRWQDIINDICQFLREKYGRFNHNNNINKPEVLEYCLRTLSNFPRIDNNSHSFLFDIHQIKIMNTKNNDLNLYGINLKGFILWGCDFENINFSKVNFEDTNLAGTEFKQCGMEYCNFKNAIIETSFMDNNRATLFQKCNLWENNLNESKLERCCFENNLNIDYRPIQYLIDAGRIFFGKNHMC